MSILIILAYHTVQCFLLSFNALGNKEAINALHKTNHVISYSKTCVQNAASARIVSEDRLHVPFFHENVTTHNTIDNNYICNFSSFYYRRKAKFTIQWGTKETTSSKKWDKPLDHWATAMKYRKAQRSWLISQVWNVVWYWSTKLTLKRNIAWSLCGVT